MLQRGISYKEEYFQDNLCSVLVQTHRWLWVDDFSIRNFKSNTLKYAWESPPLSVMITSQYNCVLTNIMTPT